MNNQIAREIIQISERELKRSPINTLRRHLAGTGMTDAEIVELASKGPEFVGNYTRFGFQIEVTSEFDPLGFIMAWEMGEHLTSQEIVNGFCHLANSGILDNLQGNYGRTFQSFIDGGLVFQRDGKYVSDL